MLRDAGAKEVHMRIASPQIISPCFYGVDISTYDELISAHHTIEEVKEMIGADSLAFLSEESLYRSFSSFAVMCSLFYRQISDRTLLLH